MPLKIKYLVTLEQVQSIAEEYLARQVQMLYLMTFLSDNDLEKLKNWLVNHPRYQKINGLQSIFDTFH